MVSRRGSDATHVRRQILLPLIAVLIVIAGIFTITAYSFRERAQRVALDRSTQAIQGMFRLQLDQDAQLMRAAIESMAVHPALTRLIEQKDAAGLSHYLEPLFEQLRERHRITHLSVSSADRKVLMRLIAPGRSGQVAQRVAMLDGAADAEEVSGLDLSPLGILTLRTVAPVHDGQDHVVGFVELAEDVAPLADAVHRVLGLDLLILVYKDLLDREKWEEGNRLTGGQNSWDELTRSVEVANTLQSVPTALGLLLELDTPPRKAVIGRDGKNRLLAISAIPLLDVAQQKIGQIVVLRDVTASEHNFYWTMAAILALTAAAMAGLVLWIRFALNRIGRTEETRQEAGDI